MKEPIRLHGICESCLAIVPEGYDPTFGVRWCRHTEVLLLDAQIVGLQEIGRLVSIYPVSEAVYTSIIEDAKEKALARLATQRQETLQ